MDESGGAYFKIVFYFYWGFNEKNAGWKPFQLGENWGFHQVASYRLDRQQDDDLPQVQVKSL